MPNPRDGSLSATSTSGGRSERFRSHRAFAAIWDQATKRESRAEQQLRREAAARVAGRVLELGVGVGANWPYLAETLEYEGVEPDIHMLRRARRRAASMGRTLSLKCARAEALPFESETFDTVLVTFTLCTVQDPASALSEVMRVLKPGGALVFVEHVRPDGTVSGWLMDRVTPAWQRVAGGCQPNRKTADTIVQAGFEIETMDRRRANGLPMISGVARKASS